jgi:hypothetical protein
MKLKKCKTSSILIDLANSSFNKLNEEFSIQEFHLLSFIKDKSREYGLLHNWAKDNINLPYYLNIPAKKVYVLVPKKEKVPELFYDKKKLKVSLFTDFNTIGNFHNLIKLLLAQYFELTENFVSNDKFFIHAFLNRANNWATVLKIELAHNFKIKNEIEFTINDSATRLKQISVEEHSKYYSRKIVYGKSIKNKQLFFKQLKQSEIKKFENDLFSEPNSNNLTKTKTKINFHSIMNASEHESSKAFLLERFSTNFLKFINDFGIKASAKELNLEKVEFSDNRAVLAIKNFNVSLVDGRMAKKLSLKEIFSSNNDITFTEKTIPELRENDICLFVMDYSKEDFGEIFKDETDPYKSFKESPDYAKISKQGICINENYFDEEVGKTELNKEDYLNYEGLCKEDFERNLSICISQLFLKSILISKNASLLPHFVDLKTHIFCFRNYLLFIEMDNLEIQKFETVGELLDIVSAKFSNLNTIELYENISNYHNPFANGKDFDFLTHKIIFSNESVIEIEDIPERAFYDEAKIKERIAERSMKRTKSEFKSKNNDTVSIHFNNFIDETVEDLFISYEELKMKYGKGENGFLKQIFEAKNETPFINFLNSNSDIHIEGLKQDNIFSIYTGVWYDKQQQQYFVGRTNGYQYKQEKGFQMRKVITHFGAFNEQTFFNLLNVDFIRYKEITVNPYPFKLIEMFDLINSDTLVTTQ